MKRMYTGSCHCGAIRFKFASEPIATGMRCNDGKAPFADLTARRI